VISIDICGLLQSCICDNFNDGKHQPVKIIQRPS
jgi:hypothetical protein